MIGLFNETFPPVYDGVAMTVVNYAHWLKERGLDPCVVTLSDPDAQDNVPYPVYRFASLPIPGRKPYRYGIPSWDRKFMKMIHEKQFELIHMHTPFSSGEVAIKVAKAQNIPLVATFHSKYRDDFSRQIPIKAIVDNIIKGAVDKLNQADEVWIPQSSVEPTLREYGYKGHIEVVENGIDYVAEDKSLYRDAMREKLGVAKNEMMMLYVGQHIWTKNIGMILDSLGLIKDMPFKLVTVGTGVAVDGIRKKARQLGFADKLKMVGVVSDRDELKRIYAASDLFLFPSLYDTFGLVVREAAAMHTPSVLLENSSAAQQVSHGINGFLSANDNQSFANTIRYLIENPDVAQRVGDTASRTLVRSWESVVDEVILRYKDLINQKKYSH